MSSASARRTDQAQSSQQAMTALNSTDRAHLPLGKRGAFEGVARRHGRRRNPARTLSRSSLRTPENQLRDSPQRWVEKCDRSVANSDTPQHPRPKLEQPPRRPRSILDSGLSRRNTVLRCQPANMSLTTRRATRQARRPLSRAIPPYRRKPTGPGLTTLPPYENYEIRARARKSGRN